MNIKALALAHLAQRKENCNFWNQLNYWKANRWLPEEGFFSVLVYGPPKTFKSELRERFKKLWPQCSTTEAIQIRNGRMLYTRDGADYGLILRTWVLRREFDGGWGWKAEMVEVEKNRFFAVDYEKNFIFDDGEHGTETEVRSRQYNLVPMQPLK